MSITRVQYKKCHGAYWIGKRVRLIAGITTNGGAHYPAGSEAVIQRKFQGFELLSAPCPHCGVVLRMKNVPPRYLELIEEMVG